VTQTILYYTFTLPKKEGLMTFLQENNGRLEDDPGGHPTVVVPQFDPLDLTVPMEVLLRGDKPIVITAVSPSAQVSTPHPRPPLKTPKPAPAFYIPTALAKHWGVCVDKVLRFIHDGELPAFNVASRQSTVPRYRISLDAVCGFEAAHGACPAGPQPKAPARRKKPTGTAAVHHYF